MTHLEMNQAVPLVLGQDGVIRFAGSRVTLDSVIREFKRGSTAEQIQEDFPSLTPRDLYAAIAYCLQHTESAEAHLREQNRAAD